MEDKRCCCGSKAEAIPEEMIFEIPEEAMENCCRTKHRSDKEMKDLIHRLNRIEGQIRGIRSMVEEERYCVDILTQVSAVRSALTSFNRILLEQHIRTCVVEKIQQGEEEVVDELCDVVQKLLR